VKQEATRKALSTWDGVPCLAEQEWTRMAAATRGGCARETEQWLRRAAAAVCGCGCRQAEQMERSAAAETRCGVAREK